MRLLSLSECDLETGHLVLRFFTGSSTPEYAILSHRWTEGEVLFEDVERDAAIDRQGYFKLKGAILQACADGYAYLWDDTCCIDKSSSAELSEAINSMWTWYQDAETCYAYLCDVSPTADDPDFEYAFRSSAWFTRGWTLQELIAPSHVSFYNETWSYIGTRERLHEMITSVTGIEASYLNHSLPLSSASIARRMSWASTRQTTRPEDIAYCLMGIFSVNMPMLYGEGSKAFQRLQEEILKISDDESIFAWRDEDSKPEDIHGLLADSPVHFIYSSGISPRQVPTGQEPLQTTSRGLRVQRSLELDQQWLPLNCQYRNRASHLAIEVIGLHKGSKQYARRRLAELEMCPKISEEPQTLYFPQVIPDSRRFASPEERAHGMTPVLSEQMRQNKAYTQISHIGRLHPLRHELEKEWTSSMYYCVPKHGTHAEYVADFTRRVDGSCVHVTIGSLNGANLGFTAAAGRVLSSLRTVEPQSSKCCKDRYAASAVQIGLSVDVENKHRVTVSYGETDGSKRSRHVLVVDIVALDEPRAVEALSSHRKSCCCVQ